MGTCRGEAPPSCCARPFCRLKAPLGFHCFANANFTYLDNGNVNFPDNKKYSRSKPTIIRIPPTTLMPIRLTLLFFIILFAKTNSSAPTTIIKTDINGYMSFLLSNSELSFSVCHSLRTQKAPCARCVLTPRLQTSCPSSCGYHTSDGSGQGCPAGCSGRCRYAPA